VRVKKPSQRRLALDHRARPCARIRGALRPPGWTSTYVPGVRAPAGNSGGRWAVGSGWCRGGGRFSGVGTGRDGYGGYGEKAGEPRGPERRGEGRRAKKEREARVAPQLEIRGEPRNTCPAKVQPPPCGRGAPRKGRRCAADRRRWYTPGAVSSRATTGRPPCPRRVSRPRGKGPRATPAPPPSRGTRSRRLSSSSSNRSNRSSSSSSSSSSRAACEGGPGARPGGPAREGRQDRAHRRALRDRSQAVRQVSRESGSCPTRSVSLGHWGGKTLLIQPVTHAIDLFIIIFVFFPFFFYLFSLASLTMSFG
jgi:hypothetical protein